MATYYQKTKERSQQLFVKSIKSFWRIIIRKKSDNMLQKDIETFLNMENVWWGYNIITNAEK